MFLSLQRVDHENTQNGNHPISKCPYSSTSERPSQRKLQQLHSSNTCLTGHVMRTILPCSYRGTDLILPYQSSKNQLMKNEAKQLKHSVENRELISGVKYEAKMSVCR